jgi:hypothetical protein
MGVMSHQGQEATGRGRMETDARPRDRQARKRSGGREELTGSSKPKRYR